MGKKFKQLIAFMLAIILVIPLPINVYGGDDSPYGGDNGGGGKDGATSTAAGGASESKYGYRIYIVDEDGNLVTKAGNKTIDHPVIDMVSDTNAVKSCNVKYKATRFGNYTGGVVTAKLPDTIPKPYYYSGKAFVGNGKAVQKWSMSKSKNDYQKISVMVGQAFGEGTTNKLRKDSEEKGINYYCILEPITWHSVFKTANKNSKTSTVFYGTAYNWTKFYQDNELRSTYTSSLDTDVLCKCMVLSEKQFGLKVPKKKNGNITYADMQTWGYGIHVYPLSTERKYNIVKKYVTYNNETKKYKVDKTTTETTSKNSIKVVAKDSKDSKYKFKKWSVSTSKSTEVTAVAGGKLVWQVPEKEIATSDKSGTVDMKSIGKGNSKGKGTTIYILYVAIGN